MTALDFGGARLQGRVPITAALLNRLFRSSRNNVVSNLHIEIKQANEVVVTYKMFHATATLGPLVQLPARPQVHLRLASRIVAWGLASSVKLPHVHFEGRDVTVDLNGFELIRKYEYLWRYLGPLRLSTVPGKLNIDFDAQIEEDK
jgi:hypothetical protein